VKQGDAVWIKCGGAVAWYGIDIRGRDAVFLLNPQPRPQPQSFNKNMGLDLSSSTAGSLSVVTRCGRAGRCPAQQ
jgi:hypothetical protein